MFLRLVQGTKQIMAVITKLLQNSNKLSHMTRYTDLLKKRWSLIFLSDIKRLAAVCHA
jgi:hypothetical protein